jgi:hypothetical protein
MPKILVGDDQQLKPTRLGAVEQFAITDALPMHVDGGRNVMPGERARNLNRDGFVEEDSHATSSSIRSWPRRRTCVASSRFTEGNVSKKYSKERPSARYSNSVRTGTRVPLKTGVPFRILGSRVIRESALISTSSYQKKFAMARPRSVRGGLALAHRARATSNFSKF